MVRAKTRGKGYYAEPELKWPEHVSLGVAALALIAKHGGFGFVTYDDLLEDWIKIVPHENAYDMLRYYVNSRSNIIIKKREGRKVKFALKRTGWEYLLYHYKKGNLPDAKMEKSKGLKNNKR